MSVWHTRNAIMIRFRFGNEQAGWPRVPFPAGERRA